MHQKEYSSVGSGAQAHNKKKLSSEDKYVALKDDIIKIPEPASSIVDFESQEDRRHFEDHPLAKFYDRLPHPLELWQQNIPAKGWMIRVFQITPGFRIRCPYPEGGQPDKRTTMMIKELRRDCRKSKLGMPPRDDKLEDLHFVKVVG